MRLQLLTFAALAVFVQGSPDADVGGGGEAPPAAEGKALFGSPQLAAKLGVALPRGDPDPGSGGLKPFRIPTPLNADNQEGADNGQSPIIDSNVNVDSAKRDDDDDDVPAPIDLTRPQGIAPVDADALFRADPASPPAVLMTGLVAAKAPGAEVAAAREEVGGEGEGEEEEGNPDVSPVSEKQSPAGAFHLLDGWLPGKAASPTPASAAAAAAAGDSAVESDEQPLSSGDGGNAVRAEEAAAGEEAGVDVDNGVGRDEGAGVTIQAALSHSGLAAGVSGGKGVEAKAVDGLAALDGAVKEGAAEDSGVSEGPADDENVVGVAPSPSEPPVVAGGVTTSPSHTGRIMLASIGLVAVAGGGCVCYARRRRHASSPYESFAHSRGIAPSTSVFHVFGRSRTKEPPRQYVPVN